MISCACACILASPRRPRARRCSTLLQRRLDLLALLGLDSRPISMCIHDSRDTSCGRSARSTAVVVGEDLLQLRR